MKKTLLNLSILAFSFGVISDALAADVPLRITPHRIHIDAENRVKAITVTNETGKKKAYRIELETRYMYPVGGTHLVSDTAEFSAVPLLRVSPRRVVLEDGQRQAIRFQVRKKKGVADGDYFAHVKFVELEVPMSLTEKEAEKKRLLEMGSKGLAFDIQARINVASPVTVSVGDVNSDMEVTGVERLPNQGNMPLLGVHVNRAGNAQGNGYFFARFKSNDRLDEKPVEVVRAVPFHMYRNLDKIRAKVRITNPDVALENGTLIVTLHKTNSSSSPVISTYKWEI